jgi:hypothetical protein
MFQMCVRARCVPTLWKRALQVPIPKRSVEEDPANRGNFRGITMQSAMGKLFCHVLQDKYLTENYEAAMCVTSRVVGSIMIADVRTATPFILAYTIHRSIVEGRGLYVGLCGYPESLPQCLAGWIIL